MTLFGHELIRRLGFLAVATHMAACGRSEPAPSTDTAVVAPLPDVGEGEPEPEPAPRSHIATIEAFVTAWNSGKTSEALAVLSRDALVIPVDSPAIAEVRGRSKATELLTRQRSMLVNPTLTIGRIIDAGEYAVVEYVSSGEFKTGATGDTPAGRYAMPVAHVFHFNTKGAVDRMWIFQDDEILMWQMGLRADKPEGHVFEALPETRVVVNAARNDTLVKAHAGFFEKLATPEALDNVLAERVSDVFAMRDARSGKVFDKGNFGEWLKGMARDYTDLRSDVELAITAGDLGAFVVNRTGNYKGRDGETQVQWKSLDIVRFEDGKLVELTVYINGAGILQQLGRLPRP